MKVLFKLSTEQMILSLIPLVPRLKLTEILCKYQCSTYANYNIPKYIIILETINKFISYQDIIKYY